MPCSGFLCRKTRRERESNPHLPYGRANAPGCRGEVDRYNHPAVKSKSRTENFRPVTDSAPSCHAVVAVYPRAAGSRETSCTETHCPWLTGFVFPASGMYGPSGVVLRRLFRAWRRSSPFRADGMPCAPRNPRGSCPFRTGRKSRRRNRRTGFTHPSSSPPRQKERDSGCGSLADLGERALGALPPVVPPREAV